MEKRYLVFVSSTYTDLKEERQEVISALLRKNCFPVAMEYFPAMNRKSVDYIKEAIDQCDFCIFIVAGRYGSSQDENGVSMTEIEFDYAMKQKKPVNIYLYEGSPLPSNKIEETDQGKEKFKKFIEKMKRTEYAYDTWSNKDRLASNVKDGIDELKRNNEGVGWIRADESNNIKAVEILNLRNKIEALQRELEDWRSPTNHSDLSQGEDLFNLEFTYENSPRNGLGTRAVQSESSLNLSWNGIFKQIGPFMRFACDESSLLRSLSILVQKKTNHTTCGVIFSSLDTILNQFEMLGFISPSQSAHYSWELTASGAKYLSDLLAVRRENVHKHTE